MDATPPTHGPESESENEENGSGAESGVEEEAGGNPLLAIFQNILAEAQEYEAMQASLDGRRNKSSHLWEACKHRCDCYVCEGLPEGEGLDDEPGQDPTTWHWPVARGRRHVVLGKIFWWRGLFRYLDRHEDGMQPPYGRCQIRPLGGADECHTFSLEGSRDNPPDDDSFMHRGVILRLRRYGDVFERYCGCADELIFVTSTDTGATADLATHKYVAVDLVADEVQPNGNAMLAPEWNWSWYGRRGAATIVDAATVKRGADRYKFEFYDWPRRRLVSLRKLVDERRAAPPGFALSGGRLVRARRTTRASRRPTNPLTSWQRDDKAKERPLDVTLLSILFDRTTVPDDVFRRIVSYHGTLQPERPWLRRVDDKDVKAAAEEAESDGSEAAQD